MYHEIESTLGQLREALERHAEAVRKVAVELDACADFNERGVTVNDIQDRHQPSQADSES